MKKICKTDDKKKVGKWAKTDRFICSRCGALAEKKKHLCKPEKQK